MKVSVRSGQVLGALAAGLLLTSALVPSGSAQAQEAKKPNILFIMGDDIGWMQPSIYHRGLMVGETPNIDRIGQRGRHLHGLRTRMQSCTAGRNAFFTGMYPLRTGMIPPQLPGARPTCGRARRRSRSSCTTSATPPASSARTTWAITPRRCRPRMASRSSGATCTTWTRCRG